MSGFGRLLVLGCASACAFALAGSAPTATRPPAGQIVVVPFAARPGRHAGVELVIRSYSQAVAPARVVTYVPYGYSLRLSGTPGRVIGEAGAVFLRKARPRVLYVPGGFRQGDRTKLASDPRAQACAPGPHEAVWIASFKVKKRTIAIRFYVDHTRGAEASLGAYRLVACLASPYVPPSEGGAYGGLHPLELNLSLFQGQRFVLTKPAAAGTYTWRVFVTPFVPDTATPNTPATFEARTRVQQPHRLSLRATYLRRKRTLLLTGRLLVLGKARPGVRVRFYGVGPRGPIHFGKTRTRGDGRYSLLRLVSLQRKHRVLDLGATVDEARGPCTSPSTAAGACVDENLSPPQIATAHVRIPGLGPG